MQCDIQDQRTDHTALRHALDGGGESRTGLNEARLQPAGDQPLAGKAVHHGEYVIMADRIERARQVGVENPHPLGVPAQGGEQTLDRVMAAAARSKPIALGLEPGFPLRLQRLADPCLVAPVQDHWNAERSHFGLVMSLRDIHPFDRDGSPRASGGVHLHRHLGAGLGGQRDLPIDTGSRPARVALRHLPHAHQRVRPAPQHQLLQVPDPGQVPIPDRLEDPAPQPPYPLLMQPPIDLFPGVGVEHARRVLRSVHRSVQLVLWFRHLRPLRLQRLTCPRQHPIRGSRHQVWYPTGYPTSIRGKDPDLAVVGFPLSFDHRRSLLGHPVPPGIPPRSLSAYHHHTRLPAHAAWTQTRVYRVPHA